MCFSCSLVIAASPLVVQDHDDGQRGPGAAVPRTPERNRPDLVPDRPRTYVASVEILTDVLDRVRLKGTLLFHYEFGRPWGVAAQRVSCIVQSNSLFEKLGINGCGEGDHASAKRSSITLNPRAQFRSPFQRSAGIVHNDT
jgi:hypothetical protein